MSRVVGPAGRLECVIRHRARQPASQTETRTTVRLLSPADTAPARPPSGRTSGGRHRVPALPTFGVEEEFTLLDAATAHVAPVAPEVIAGCADTHGVVAEVMAHMIETRTPVSRSLGELRQALLARRIAVSCEAARAGVLVVAAGVAPLAQSEPPQLTDDARYRALAARFPAAVSTAGTMGCHVHVAVPSRAAGVEVLRRSRPWIPALIALTSNSPIYERQDTGWASWRYRLMTRWPTASPAPPVASDLAYDDAVAAAIAAGDALDMRNVYYFIRLSPRYPTVEIRVADVLPTADEAAAYAALVRALAVQTMHDADVNRSAPRIDQRRLSSACEAAARGGAEGAAVDVSTNEVVRGWDLVDQFLRYVLPSLARDPDAARVLSTIELIRLSGTGAERTRRLWQDTQDVTAFATSLARSTTAHGPQPGTLGPRPPVSRAASSLGGAPARDDDE